MVWRSAHNTLRHLVRRDPLGWYPLLAVYYLTYACDLRCPYCSDGAGRPYWKLRSKILRREEILELLSIVRRHCDYLVLTGGEPLKHPDFGWVLAQLPALRFDGVVLTTIGLDLEPHLDAIARSVRYLVFSLETLDREKADRWFGRGSGVFDRILSNIEQAQRLASRKPEIVISSVATPDNLDDLFAVYAYARRHAFRFAVCPQLRGVQPHPGLGDNPTYRRLFDTLIADKKRGFAINGTVAYLKHMRDLKPFACRPSTVLAISPAGEAFYPCLEIGKLAGNLLACPDLHRLRAEGRRLHGPEPDCGNQCHSACALGFALILNQPLTAISELGLMLKGYVQVLSRGR